MGRMIAFIIFYCIFSIIALGAFIAAGLEKDYEDMKVIHYLASLLGPIVFPIILGCVLSKIMFSDKL